MTYARTRKHYRAAKKEIEHNPTNGVFIPNKDKSKVAAAAGAAGVIIFIMGLLIGLVAGDN